MLKKYFKRPTNISLVKLKSRYCNYFLCFSNLLKIKDSEAIKTRPDVTCLFSPPGSGKTVVVLKFIYHMMKMGTDTNFIILVTPVHLFLPVFWKLILLFFSEHPASVVQIFSSTFSKPGSGISHGGGQNVKFLSPPRWNWSSAVRFFTVEQSIKESLSWICLLFKQLLSRHGSFFEFLLTLEK